MTTRYWVGASNGTSNDYSDAANWNPEGVPASGDVLFVGAAGNVVVNQAIDQVTINLNSVELENPATLTIDNVVLGSGVVLTTRAAQPFAKLVLQEQAEFNGQVTGSGNLVVASALAGTGTIEIGGGAEVTLGSVPSSTTVRFADNNGTLVLSDPGAFKGTVTNLQAGDRIVLPSDGAYAATYADGFLTVLGDGPETLARFPLLFADTPLTFSVEDRAGGVALVTSSLSQDWNGGTGDWYDAANWSGQATPLGGDQVQIASGSVTISAADFVQYGALDFQDVTLGHAGQSAPVTLTLPHGYTLGNDLLLNVTGSTLDGSAPLTTLVAPGATLLAGDLRVNSLGGTLEVKLSPTLDGQAGSFTILDRVDESSYGSVYVGQSSHLVFTGGAVRNDGVVVVEGKALLDATTQLDGGGTIVVRGGGNLEIDGAASAGAILTFADEGLVAGGRITIGDLSQFEATIKPGQHGDEIVLENVSATQGIYASGVLRLFDASGDPVGSLKVAPLVTPANGVTTADFTITAAGDETVVAYTPSPLIVQDSLPVAAIGEPGSTIGFADLLLKAFGSSAPAGFEHFVLKDLWTGDNALPKLLPGQTETSYWGTGDQAVDSRWLLDGKPIDRFTPVTAADIDRVSLVIGNSMLNTAAFSVLTAGTLQDPLIHRNYNIWTTQPAVEAGNFASGNIAPSDIVTATERFESVYPAIPNDNNCNWIADNVAAAAGAVMPYANFSNIPTQNLEGGFWRVAYRGDDPADNPVQDWSTLVQPGDVVRMVWVKGEGHHTTTVTGVVSGEYITVYDNDDFGEQEGRYHFIDSHRASYWNETTVGGTTIYRLDPNHQYLIGGTEFAETLQGSVYNNLIRPNGGADVITGGRGDNEVQGTAAQLDGIAITDWHDGNWLDATDLTPGTASVSYNASLGFLSIQGLSNGTGGAAAGTALSATVKLSTGLQETFFVASDPFGPGVEVRSLPVSDSIGFDFALTDATVTFVGGHTLVAGTDGLARNVTGIGTLVFTDGTIVEKDGFALVDDLFYFARNLDVWAAHNDGRGVDADAHYLNGGWREGRDPNAFFSTDGYRAANPDVAAAGVDPLIHYHNGGWSEGRTAAGLGRTEDHFSAEAYRAAYADVREAGVDPLAHFLAADVGEGRLSIIG